MTTISYEQQHRTTELESDSTFMGNPYQTSYKVTAADIKVGWLFDIPPLIDMVSACVCIMCVYLHLNGEFFMGRDPIQLFWRWLMTWLRTWCSGEEQLLTRTIRREQPVMKNQIQPTPTTVWRQLNYGEWPPVPTNDSTTMTRIVPTREIQYIKLHIVNHWY